jgi:hypothetical protein
MRVMSRDPFATFPPRDGRRSRRAPSPGPAEVAESLRRLDTLARVLDSVVKLPGSEIRVGVDALIGLVPVIGDIISGAISSYILLEARRLGASRWLLARMATNTAIDTVVGAVPIVGDVFDVAYRANMKNIALLRRHIERTHPAAAAGAMRGAVIDGEAVRVG